MLILASSSPRRKELLKKLTPSFTILPPDIDESSLPLEAKDLPGELSKEKAYAVFSKHLEDQVLACDTIVVLNGKVLGKPKDEEDAFRMLKEESGKKQIVLSGYTFLSKDVEITRTVSTEVYFQELSDELIWDYIKTKKPLDKAGAYGIQDGYPLIKEIRGSFDNVMGLPTEDIAQHVLPFIR